MSEEQIEHTEEIVDDAEVVETDVEETAESEAQEPNEPQLYELPDGSMVDGETLAKSYRELLPEYTKATQRLSAIENKKEEPQAQPWDNPEWEAQTTAELLQAAEARALARISAQQQQAQERAKAEQQAIEEYVNKETEELQKLDPDVDVNAVMAHAAKYGFSSLLKAHANFKDMQQDKQLAQERAVKNAEKKKDNVSHETVKGADGIQVPSNMGLREGAHEALRQLSN